MSSPSLDISGLRRRRSLLHHSSHTTPSSKTTISSSYAMVEVSPVLGHNVVESVQSPMDDEQDNENESDNSTSELDTESESSEADLGEDGEDGDGKASGVPGHRPSTTSNGRGDGKGNGSSANYGNGNGHTSFPDKRRVRINSPHVDTQVPHRRPTRSDPQSPTSPSRRAWYEFDLAVVVALVSPVGSWLTGGDHVKNLLLVSLLIFYLHQVVEVPWSLYHACRARHKVAARSADASTKSAASSLLALELFFLALTVLSPLLGALLLRVVGNAIVGPDALSWFNVTLFVLATGLRPWRHLIDRMAGAAEEMQGIVCEGACGGRCQSSSEIEEQTQLEEQRAQQTDILLHRLEAMEAELAKLKTRMSVRQDELYDYVDEAVEVVDKRIGDAEQRLVRTMHDVDEVGAYVRHWGRTYSATYLDILPKWIARTLALPFSIQSQPTSSVDRKQEHIHHHHHSGSSANTLRTASYKSTTNHGTTPYASVYASPNGSTATVFSKKLEPIPEEDSYPPPAPTIIRSSEVPPPTPLEFIGSLAFLPFRIVRGVVSWSTGYVYGP